MTNGKNSSLPHKIPFLELIAHIAIKTLPLI
jgi:hypothetical protein